MLMRYALLVICFILVPHNNISEEFVDRFIYLTFKVYAVDWSPDGQRVVSGGKDKVIKM